MWKCYSRQSWLEFRGWESNLRVSVCPFHSSLLCCLIPRGNRCMTPMTIFTYLFYLPLRHFFFCFSLWNTHFSLLSVSSPILLKISARSHPPPLCRKYDPKEEDPSSSQECHDLQSSRGSEAPSLDQGCSKELRSSSAAPGSCWAASSPPSTVVSALLLPSSLFLPPLHGNHWLKGRKNKQRRLLIKGGLLILRH